MGNLKKITDNELALLAMENNNNANTELFNRYYKYIRGILYYKGINTTDSEDLAMCIFSKIFKNIRKFNHQKSSLKSWITTITKNTIIDYFRTNKNKHQTVYFSLLESENNEEYTFDIASTLTSDAELITKENLNLLFSAIEHLPNKYKTIIELLIEEKNNSEISTITGISPNTIGVQKTRALKQLQDLLLTFKK